MINFRFDKQGLSTKLYIVKVSYNDTIGINVVLQTKLELAHVMSIVRAYLKDSYTLTIAPVTTKGLPGGYYESYALDNLLSMISRIRFYEVKTVKEAKVVYVEKVVENEL
jgi:hypothetical protein